MKPEDTILAFDRLGSRLRMNLENIEDSCDIFVKYITEAELYNPWFTRVNIIYCLTEICNWLEKEKLSDWIEPYTKRISGKNPKTIAVVTAGNIPLAGFHDMLSVLITGNNFLGRISSKDTSLFRMIKEILVDIDPRFNDHISFAEQIKDFDAVIATGSDNTSRYFDYYFGKYPSIIRHNRNSAAIIGGNETNEDLALLADDVFTYFGLGCRSVSKIFVPEGYDLKKIISGFESYRSIIQHNKYVNNYEYNKTLYLMNRDAFLDSGFFILKQDTRLSSPIAVVFFEFYKNIRKLLNHLKSESGKLQCLVAGNMPVDNRIPFGHAQKPDLKDFADNVNTIEFLLNL
ncbi:MAG: acyl-CoA reductase [Bacteroidota bacterium]